MKDILLGNDDDLVFSNGDFITGESSLQEVGIILRLNKGDLKSDPLMGTGLIRMINSKVNPDELMSVLKINLGRDGKNYDEIKDYITTAIN